MANCSIAKRHPLFKQNRLWWKMVHANSAFVNKTTVATKTLSKLFKNSKLTWKGASRIWKDRHASIKEVVLKEIVN